MNANRQVDYFSHKFSLMAIFSHFPCNRPQSCCSTPLDRHLYKGFLKLTEAKYHEDTPALLAGKNIYHYFSNLLEARSSSQFCH